MTRLVLGTNSHSQSQSLSLVLSELRSSFYNLPVQLLNSVYMKQCWLTDITVPFGDEASRSFVLIFV